MEHRVTPGIQSPGIPESERQSSESGIRKFYTSINSIFFDTRKIFVHFKNMCDLD